MSEKYENLLNLALSTREEVREKTQDLNVGYLPARRAWEVIVKYSRLPQFPEESGIVVEPLIAGYAILTVPDEKMVLLSQNVDIEYVEKSKRYLFSQLAPTEEPCVAAALSLPPYYNGKGVLMAVLDSGIDVRRREFRKQDGSTRVVAYIDYSDQGENYYDEERINRGLAGEEELPPFTDTLHGTAVTGVAAGLSLEYRGVAYGCDLMIVRLGSGDFLQTTDIMRGVNRALQLASERRQPLVINLSFGNSYGSHKGDALLERFLDNASEIGKSVIVAGTGNEGVGFGHFSAGGDSFLAPFVIGPYETNVSLQIWKDFSEEVFTLLSPSGEEMKLEATELGKKREWYLEDALLITYVGMPSPYSVMQEIYMEWIPREEYLRQGIWRIEGKGSCNLYLRGRENGLADTRFLVSEPLGTLTIPSTARRVISVGAYNPKQNAYASFSGRGLLQSGKPDVVAPGVNLLAPWGENGYLPVTGTSFAAPMVSGMAAVLMERGIVEGRDPYLYGEKLKALLRAGAGRVSGESEIPNERVGFGEACLMECFRLLKKIEQ